MNPIAHAQMDNGITTAFVKIVTILVKPVHPTVYVLVAQMEVKEHYLNLELVHVTKDGLIMVLKSVENV